MNQTFEHTIPVRVGDTTHRATVAYSVDWEEPVEIIDLTVTHIHGTRVSPATESLADYIADTIHVDHKAHAILAVHAKRVREAPARPPPFVPTDLVEKPIREAFEAAYRKLYGDPGRWHRTGMEGALGLDYADPFLWIDHHPAHPEVPPSYYRSIIQEKYVLFRAGWQANQETNHG